MHANRRSLLGSAAALLATPALDAPARAAWEVSERYPDPRVRVLDPEGKVIGAINLPERCGDLCFGATKRNRLFMVSSKSLYSVYVGAIGA